MLSCTLTHPALTRVLNFQPINPSSTLHVTTKRDSSLSTQLGFGELVKGEKDGIGNIYEMRSVQNIIPFNSKYLPISQLYPFIAAVEMNAL